jgi:hypothetical protein
MYDSFFNMYNSLDEELKRDVTYWMIAELSAIRTVTSACLIYRQVSIDNR